MIPTTSSSGIAARVILVGVALCTVGVLAYRSGWWSPEAPKDQAAKSTEVAESRMDAPQGERELLDKPVGVPEVPDLFAVRTWEPPRPPPPKPLPPPPPQAPPLPFRLIGRIDDPDRGLAFLLADANRVLSVSIGTEIDNLYQVEKYENGQLYFRYRPLNVSQTLLVGSNL